METEKTNPSAKNRLKWEQGFIIAMICVLVVGQVYIKIQLKDIKKAMKSEISSKGEEVKKSVQEASEPKGATLQASEIFVKREEMVKIVGESAEKQANTLKSIEKLQEQLDKIVQNLSGNKTGKADENKAVALLSADILSMKKDLGQLQQDVQKTKLALDRNSNAALYLEICFKEERIEKRGDLEHGRQCSQLEKSLNLQQGTSFKPF